MRIKSADLKNKFLFWSFAAFHACDGNDRHDIMSAQKRSCWPGTCRAMSMRAKRSYLGVTFLLVSDGSKGKVRRHVLRSV